MIRTLSIFLFSGLLSTTFAAVEVTKDTLFMGSHFQFTAVSETEEEASNVIQEAMREVDRIEQDISSWIGSSMTSQINDQAGVAPVKVSWELFQLIERSKKVSQLSDGAFDISFASADRIWKFDGSMKEIPNNSTIANSVRLIDYTEIILNEADTTVFLSKTGMRIGFGGIGKGYAADRAKQVMINAGAKNGVVNAGGDLLCWGTPPDRESWSIGVMDPRDEKNVLSFLHVSNTAVVTSGDYEKFVNIDGERYAHIINPKTGWPSKNLVSVTVITENAELADALATTVFVLGPKNGKHLVEQLKGVEAVLINDKMEVSTTSGIELDTMGEEFSVKIDE